MPGKSPEGTRRDYEALKREIAQHDYRYYVLDDPLISDAKYDGLMRRLLQIEKEHPGWITLDSPSQRVGAKPLTELKPYTHHQPMLSLANAYDEEEVREWHGQLLNHLKAEELVSDFVCEPKLDGLAVEVIYEHGCYLRGSTRGDGKTGEDVTENIRTIRSLPLILIDDGRGLPEYLEVRGEVIIEKSKFSALNRQRMETGEEPFANPRNLAAGSLKQLNPRVTAERPLDLYIYGLGEVQGFTLDTHVSMMERLARMGLKTLRPYSKAGDLEGAIHHYNSLLAERETFPFDVDGAVIRVNRYDLCRRLGVRSKSPRFALAYKFPARQETTVLESIVVQVGRTGTLTPVAKLKPVRVGGVEISRASLHNQEEIERLDVRERDTVVVERAGDVIPHIVKVLKPLRPPGTRLFTLPKQCPVCKSAVVEDPEEVAVRCPYPACPAVLKARIRHFVSRRAADIEGMGAKLIDQIVDRGLVKRISDLYGLKLETLAGLERMGEKSASNILAALARCREMPLARFIYALGIRHVGEHVAEVLADHFSSLQSLKSADPDELEAIKEIGPKVVESLKRFFENPDEGETLQHFLEAGVSPTASVPRQEGSLNGKSFLFTGALRVLTRNEAEARVKNLGGKVLSGISKKLDILVLGEKPGSKLAKAKALGVKIVNEADFIKLIEGD